LDTRFPHFTSRRQVNWGTVELKPSISSSAVKKRYTTEGTETTEKSDPTFLRELCGLCGESCKSIILAGKNKVYTSFGGIFPAMPYCPNCLTEYVQGTTACEDCGAQLASGSPPEAPPGTSPQTQSAGSANSKLVTVRVFTGATALMEIDVARKVLESQGIPSLVSGEISAELLPLDIPLLVPEEDAERAATILHDYLDAQAASPAE
jgi:hypothetical protein